jgi:hypothetical protein
MKDLMGEKTNEENPYAEYQLFATFPALNFSERYTLALMFHKFA